MMTKIEPIEKPANNKQQLAEISTVFLSEFSKVLGADNFNQLLAMGRSDYQKTINHLIKETSRFRELISDSSDNVLKDAILRKLNKTNKYLENLLFENEESAEWYFTNLASPTLELIKTTVDEIQTYQTDLSISDENREEEQDWMDFEKALLESMEDDTDSPEDVLPSEDPMYDHQQMLPEEEPYPWLRASIMDEIGEGDTTAREKMSVDEADTKVSEKESALPEQEVIQDLNMMELLPGEIIDYIYRTGLNSCASIEEGRKFISAFMVLGGYCRDVAADKQNPGTGIQLFESLLLGSWSASALEAAFKADNATLLEVIMVRDGDVVVREVDVDVREGDVVNNKVSKVSKFYIAGTKINEDTSTPPLLSLITGSTSRHIQVLRLPQPSH